MKYIRHFALLAVAIAFAAVPAFSQETQTRVVDEVVAQVNDGVITLSRVNREIKSIVDTYVQQGKKRDEAEKMVEEKRGELIAGLINEELLIQKAKDLGMEKSIDEAVNQKIVELMKQNGLKTVEALNSEMEKSGVDPKELRESWRKQATRDRVLQQEVQATAYWRPTGKEVKEYYEKNKSKFTKPETVSFSEIFLGFAGRDEKAVRDKAVEIIKKLRAGGDFAALQKDNSDSGLITQGSGKAEKLVVSDLVEAISKPIAGKKVGEYTDPFEIDQMGVVILKIDEREKASDESVFDERNVRLAMLQESLPDEQKKFMAKLRDDSYIKISDTYRPSVSPILFADERKEKSGN